MRTVLREHSIQTPGGKPVDSAPSLPETLKRLSAVLHEQGLEQSDVLKPEELAAATALPEDVIRSLLRGGEAPADTVNDRVRARLKTLSSAYMARTGQRMSDLAGKISRQLGVSGVWARQICSGEKTPSVELLHGLVGFFRVDGEEAFFTAPAPIALDRVLRQILAVHEPSAEGVNDGYDLLAHVRTHNDDVRSIALRRAHDLPPERWNVLNATLNALLALDDGEDDQ
ncbi:hypothetical protein [Streptomyces sp. NPDC091219]|uniref:hypothetical protein n=1 Tax=Streptomyces sp. NPDC091219 TaxID=3155193 RepID=UPI00344F364E